MIILKIIGMFILMFFTQILGWMSSIVTLIKETIGNYFKMINISKLKFENGCYSEKKLGIKEYFIPIIFLVIPTILGIFLWILQGLFLIITIIPMALIQAITNINKNGNNTL